MPGSISDCYEHGFKECGNAACPPVCPTNYRSENFKYANDKTAFLLFRRSLLEAYLNNSEALDILKKAGYEDFSFGKILLRFKKHYEAYLNDEHKQFPHEMGLLLGYPIEDVRGFIEHNGCGCLYSGYWKVYRNVPLKKKMFEDFEKAKESVIQLLAEDIDMRLILEIYKEEPQQIAV